MSYDASNAYDTKEAYDAYRSLYKGQLLMGVEVGRDACVLLGHAMLLGHG